MLEKIVSVGRHITSVLVVGVIVITNAANADIINPNVLELTQPDGTKIELRFKGTQRLNWYEDLSGFPVELIGDTYYYSSGLGATSARSALLEVGKGNPKEFGVEKISQFDRTAYFNSTDPNRLGSLGINSNGNNDIQRVPPVGTVKNLVVLIRFDDHASRTLPSQSDFDTLFNAVGGHPTLAPTGSIRDIYLENSYGQLTLDSTVLDWINVSETEAYYANGQSGDQTLWEALIEALDEADESLDFSQFDSDSDGFIDAITFVHSGYAAEFGGTDQYGASQADRIWSHKWNISPTWTSDESVSVSAYNINPGVWSTSGTAIGRVGVIAHELGHFFGLPDLYAYTQGDGIGSWGLMANSWGFSGTQLNPPHMSAWSKIELGWVTPTTLTSPGTYTINQAETNPEIYKVDDGFPTGEYLLIENRQPVGIESTMPQGGLAIFHIDESRGYHDTSYPPNTDWPDNHYQVALKQADGFYDLERGNDRGDSTDPYHGGGVSTLSATTDPSTNSYQSGSFVPTDILISNISASGNPMTFDYGTPPPNPDFTYPLGGEVFTQGTTETITWDVNGAPASTVYSLEVGMCGSTNELYEDVQTTPYNFSASNAGGVYDFAVDTNNPYEGSANWHADNPAEVGDQYLESTLFTVPALSSALSFWHSYDLEASWDGGVVEISTDSGTTWVDLGGAITVNGYNDILNNTPNPLGGRQAFSGDSGGYVNTIVDLTDYAGLSAKIRFRLGSDTIIGLPPTYTGWDIDLIVVSGATGTLSPIGSTTGSSLAWVVTEPVGDDYCFSIQGADSTGTTDVVYSELIDIQAGGGLTCNGLAVTVDLSLGQTTTSNDDVVMGTPSADVIRGKGGNDTICGMGGDDYIHGNSGDDWIHGGSGVDNIRGGQGSDTIYTGAGATVGTGSRAFGGYGDDLIFGGDDADDLRGGRGNDEINGYRGNDELYGNDDDDYLHGGGGDDYLKGGNGNDDLVGGSATDYCDGGGGAADTAAANCESVVNIP